MDRGQIEAWALRVVTAVENGEKVEDSNVELKAEWPEDHARAARQLAGLANAARSPAVLWLVGVKEGEGVVPFASVELSKWWTSVSRWFDPPAPGLYDLVTYVHEKAFVALAFDVSARPFVTKNPDGGLPFLVPWREGTRTRTATRAELLQMVVPAATAPTLEILQLELRATKPNPPQDQQWWADLDAYVHQPHDAVLVLPRHRTTGEIDLPEYRVRLDCEYGLFFDPDQRPRTRPQPGDAVTRGPGRLSVRLPTVLKFHAGMAISPADPLDDARVSIRLLPANSQTPLVVQESLRPQVQDEPANTWLWVLRRGT